MAKLHERLTKKIVVKPRSKTKKTAASKKSKAKSRKKTAVKPKASVKKPKKEAPKVREDLWKSPGQPLRLEKKQTKAKQQITPADVVKRSKRK